MMRKIYDEELKINFYEPDCVEEWLELIWDIGADYDGCYTVESLQSLIDEQMEMVSRARRCLRDGAIYVDNDYHAGGEIE